MFLLVFWALSFEMITFQPLIYLAFSLKNLHTNHLKFPIRVLCWTCLPLEEFRVIQDFKAPITSSITGIGKGKLKYPITENVYIAIQPTMWYILENLIFWFVVMADCL